jgi:hypothetical protein
MSLLTWLTDIPCPEIPKPSFITGMIRCLFSVNCVLFMPLDLNLVILVGFNFNSYQEVIELSFFFIGNKILLKATSQCFY